MKVTVYSHNEPIGTSELQAGDRSMGHIYGEFTPNEYYYPDTQKQIWNTHNAHSSWDSLRLNVQLENGYFLFPEGGITIDDLEELPEEPKRIDIAGIDVDMVNYFFTKEYLGQFVIEPWEKISIEQKTGYENELYIELGCDRVKKKSFFDFFNDSQVNHDLSGFKVSALCTTGQNDDVLFEIRKKKSEYRFAVIHLTWKGSKEIPDYPITVFYRSFADFKASRMDIDAADWI